MTTTPTSTLFWCAKCTTLHHPLATDGGAVQRAGTQDPAPASSRAGPRAALAACACSVSNHGSTSTMSEHQPRSAAVQKGGILRGDWQVG